MPNYRYEFVKDKFLTSIDHHNQFLCELAFRLLSLLIYTFTTPTCEGRKEAEHAGVGGRAQDNRY